MTILRIGDPHIKPGNIDECENLMHFINEKILELRPDRIEILGDLFHTHAIVRLEVLEFWHGWIDVLLSHEIPLYILIGNHDVVNTEEHAFSALHIFQNYRKKNLHIVTNPFAEGLYAYVSWYNDPKVFIEVANACAAQGAKVLICHQTFDGSKYENGFYAPDGIDTNLLNFNLIISGHLHTQQDIEKDGKRIIYPGTPKWDTVSDTNVEKGIWLFEHDNTTGAVLNKTFISTDGPAIPLISVVWVEGTEMPTIRPNTRTTIELVGSAGWIDKEKENLKGKVSVTSKRTDRVDKIDRDAGKSFPEFVMTKFESKFDKIELLKYMKGLGIVG